MSGKNPFGGNGGGSPGLPGGLPGLGVSIVGGPRGVEDVDPKDLVMSKKDIDDFIAQLEAPLVSGMPLDMPWGIPGRSLCLALRSLRVKHARIEELEARVRELEARVPPFEGEAPALDLTKFK